MSEPFLSEIRIVSFNFAPSGWALCDGQILPISQNQALYSLLGTTYGGDGQTSFALPDLRGRSPLHVGNGHDLGEEGGETDHTLSTNELPAHRHEARASSQTGETVIPTGNVLADSAPNEIYGAPTDLVALNASTVASVGGSQSHSNLQPYLVLNFVIALQGLFPSRN